MTNASIVLYNHSVAEITPLVKLLHQSGVIDTIFLIDNSEKRNPDFEIKNVTYIFNNKNIGYGAAHNIAIRKSVSVNANFHLVINPDISFEPETLTTLVQYLEQNPDVGHVMPNIVYPSGETQYLCKLIPTPFDLFFRRFMPPTLSKERMDKFELRHSHYNKIMNVPYLSGCFMLLRVSALQKVGLFDERFFMYPEDIDLTRRIHKHYKTIFYPFASIVHHHKKASYQSLKMLSIHTFNLIKYFNKWGWFFDAQRRKVNRETLKQIDAASGKVE